MSLTSLAGVPADAWHTTLMLVAAGLFALVACVCAVWLALMLRGRQMHLMRLASRLRHYAERLEHADQLLVHLARHDTLTGLPNRTCFLDRLRAAVQRVNDGEQRLVAVMLLDVDRFQLINDALGHGAGDELLCRIGERLTEGLRGFVGDDELVISRFGGDEFLLLFNGLVSMGEADDVARRIRELLAPTYRIDGRDLHSGVSIGIVRSGAICASAEELLRNADVAMYEAKRAGRGCNVVFDEGMHAQLSRHVAIESGLRRAIGTDEMTVVFQPIVELATWRLTSVEALVRWRHPTLGVIAPSEFIPVAEESGLIATLDRWVRREACRAMRQWRERDPQRAPDTVSVNVSRVELAQGDAFLGEIRALLRETGLPAHCLQLEVTEREVMREPQATLALMHSLRALGVKLAMDDFGTGTSSLGILRTYPFDTIKVDRSFVQGLSGGADALAVIHATLRLVEHLGMASLVEGIEDETQLSILMSVECRYGQGWLISRPVMAHEVLDAVACRVPDEHDELPDHDWQRRRPLLATA